MKYSAEERSNYLLVHKVRIYRSIRERVKALIPTISKQLKKYYHEYGRGETTREGTEEAVRGGGESGGSNLAEGKRGSGEA